MKKKVIWLVVSSWVMAALLLASCAPAVVEKVEKEVAPKEVAPKEVAPKEVVKKEVAPEVEKPKYGGVFTWVWKTDPLGFDERITTGMGSTWPTLQTADQLTVNDWARGPAGTNETGLIYGNPLFWLYRGMVAENVEIVEPDTLVLHIRRGIHWALDPSSEASRLMGGRELTAKDVVHSVWRQWTLPTSYARSLYPILSDMKDVNNSVWVSKDDPWAVVIKTNGEPGSVATIFESLAYDSIEPPEVIEKYGDMNDWKNVVGTGPFILKDYVKGSSITFVKNPNYWAKDPVGPGKGNQLPYLDGQKVLILPDASTRMAAMRTGQIDLLLELAKEEADGVLKTKPQIKWSVNPNRSTPTIFVRHDKVPFGDVNVRRALMLAINHEELVKEYYGGAASILNYPGPFTPEFKDFQYPFEELPADVREMFGYHPDKAEQLLDAAGLPRGKDGNRFTFSTMLWSNEQVDLASIIKEYWAKIGVTLKLDVRESGVYTKMQQARTYEQSLFSSVPAQWNIFKANVERPGIIRNQGFVTDDYADRIFKDNFAVYFDYEARAKILKERQPELIRRMFHILLPAPFEYTLWQPWVKNYHGERTISFDGSVSIQRYIWIDQDLKQEMRGRR